MGWRIEPGPAGHEAAELGIRPAAPGDAVELLKIYAPYVLETAITFEYQVPSVEEFTERIVHTQLKYPYIVAELEGRIVGYAYAGTFNPRSAYDWSAELSIYIDKSYRRCGIGRKLYRTMEELLKEMGILNVNACIAYPETEDQYLTKNSVQFHEHLGYQWVGQFHKCGYKFGRWYNMVWMEKMLGEHVDKPMAVKAFGELSVRV